MLVLSHIGQPFTSNLPLLSLSTGTAVVFGPVEGFSTPLRLSECLVGTSRLRLVVRACLHLHDGLSIGPVWSIRASWYNDLGRRRRGWLGW